MVGVYVGGCELNGMCVGSMVGWGSIVDRDRGERACCTMWRPLEWERRVRRVAWPAGEVGGRREGRRDAKVASYLCAMGG